MPNHIYCPGCFSPKMVGAPCERCEDPQDAVAALSEAIERHGPHTVCKRCGGVWRGTLPSCPSCDRPQFKPLVPLEVETMRRLPMSVQKELNLNFRFGPQTPPPGWLHISDGLSEVEPAPTTSHVTGVVLPEARLVRSPERPHGPVMGDHDPEWQKLVSWAKRFWSWLKAKVRH